MGGASRNKGARGEREMVRLLRQHLDPEHWQVERFGTGESGHDIRITGLRGDVFPWAIEVKRYADFDIGEVVRPPPSQRWLNWWRQAKVQAATVGREPLLVCRGDRRPWWAFTFWDVDNSPSYIEINHEDWRSIIGRPLEDIIGQLPFAGGWTPRA